MKTFYRKTILLTLLSITIGAPLDFGQELNFELLRKFDSSRLLELGQRSLRLLTNSERVRDSLNENDISEKFVDDKSKLSFGLENENSGMSGSEDLDSLDLNTVKNNGDSDTMSDFNFDELEGENNNSESLELEDVRNEFVNIDSVEGGSGVEMFDEVAS